MKHSHGDLFFSFVLLFGMDISLQFLGVTSTICLSKLTAPSGDSGFNF